MSSEQNLFELFVAGGFAMYPLLLASLLIWAVIFDRAWKFRKLGRELRAFQLEAMNKLLRNEEDALVAFCSNNSHLPTAQLLFFALNRLRSSDARVRANWVEALERQRQLTNQDLRKHLWILGTIASASPFIGLFGTVIGILRSFGDIARTGTGGFAVVAGGISEALIATAAGIIVAVIAAIAYNAFQTKWSSLVLTVKLQIEELAELLDTTQNPKPKTE